MSEDPEFSLDKAFEDQIDFDAIADVEESGLLPEGTYVTVPALKVTWETQPHEAYPRGRRIVRFFGQVTGRQGEEDVRGWVGFDISPDTALEPDTRRDGKPNRNAGKPDGLSRRWAQCVRAYQVAVGENPTTSGHVIAFVRDYPVQLRVGRYAPPDREARNVGYSISPVRPSATV